MDRHTPGFEVPPPGGGPREMGLPEAHIVMPPTLRERVGQLILSGFRGLTPAEASPTLGAVREGLLGGVLLYGIDAQTGGPKNVRNRDQLRTLIGAFESANGVPVTVAIDAEGGGFYQQLRPEHGFPLMPAPQDLGDTGDPALTRQAAARSAAALAEVGVTLNLAPVVDLVHVGNLVVAARKRAFSVDPEVVVAHAREFIGAHHDNGVLCTLKHFPGMGSAMSETHEGTVDVSSTWRRAELVPYRTLIGEGIVDAVMAANVFNGHLDPDHTVTMSRRVLTDLLRGELGFDGVVISDALEQLSMWDVYGFERSIVLALNAGVDQLLLANPSFDVPYDERRSRQAVDHIVAAVERGEIPVARIDESCARVLRMKARQRTLRAAATERAAGK